ncbi:MFS transporter [Rhizocola hellebori]|uniref:MFS transporter n=1 Tax=Rhizocola hellebori TaxID=1392758 RepID=A0A8J3Q4Q3_9ACTN|nr:MFS transporter [Rhizocola hellebori]GIH03749.1 MFS transporter [Rhizocola hellebori]
MSADVVAAEEIRPAPLWRDRRFRTFWVGDTVSQFGDRISELAIPFIAVTMLAATPGQVGVLTAAIWTPNLLAVLIGAWVDQRPVKRRLMIAADVLRAVTLLSIPVAYAAGVLTLAQLVVAGLLTGIGQVLFGMAYQTFYVSLVPSESYVDANSKLSMSRGVSFIAGPAAAGGLIQALTAPVAVVADALSFLVSAVLVSRIKAQEPPPAPAGPSTWRLAVDGMKVVFVQPILRASLGCTATVNFFTFIANALMILFASRELGLSAGAIGLAFGVGATGSVVGAAITPRISRVLGVGRTAIVGAAVFPLPLAFAALASGSDLQKTALLAGLEFVSGVGVMLMDINLNAVLTRATPEGARGRRAGAYSAINYGIRPVGALVGGFAGAAIGLRPCLVIAGIGGALCALWLLASPVRNLRTVEDAAAA